MTYPPTSLLADWGTATDLSARPGRLAPVEAAVLQAVDDIVSVLGAAPQGAYPTVQARIASIVAGNAGERLSVRAATNQSGTYTFATSFAAGQTLDGTVTLAIGDRILLKDLGAATQNGIYTVNASGAPTRAADFAAGADFLGTSVYVREGARAAGTTWIAQNTGVVAIGTTAIAFAPKTTRPVEITIGVKDGYHAADYVCDGVADENEFNLALFVMFLSTINHGVIRVAPGDYSFTSAITMQSDVIFRGSGRNATRFSRTTDTSIFNVSGGGAGTHTVNVHVSDLRVNGSVSPHSKPMSYVWYATNVTYERVDFAGGASVAVSILESWDVKFRACRFDTCGSKGLGPKTGFATGGEGSSGGRPAVMIYGDIATSGNGHATAPSRRIRFQACDWIAVTDGCIQVHGNGAAEDFVGQLAAVHDGVYVDQCTFETVTNTAGFAPFITAYKATVVSLSGVYAQAGSFFASGTAQNAFNFDTCTAVYVAKITCKGIEGVASIRSWLRFNGCTGIAWDLITLDHTNNPTVGVIDYAGTNNVVRGGTIERIAGPTPTYINGAPSTAMRASGTATIAISGTSVVVTHGLARTPVDGEVVIFSVSKPSGNDPGHVWVDTYTATQFTIHCATAPTGSTLVVGWRATIEDNG